MSSGIVFSLQAVSENKIFSSSLLNVYPARGGKRKEQQTSKNRQPSVQFGEERQSPVHACSLGRLHPIANYEQIGNATNVSFLFLRRRPLRSPLALFRWHVLYSFFARRCHEFGVCIRARVFVCVHNQMCICVRINTRARSMHLWLCESLFFRKRTCCAF